jgi:hypothetical protein
MTLQEVPDLVPILTRNPAGSSNHLLRGAPKRQLEIPEILCFLP